MIVSMEATLTEVRRLTGGWRAAPAVHVVESHRDLPVPVSPDTDGLAHKGEVFLVGDQSPRRVAQLVGHEAVAHVGLRRLHGRAKWTSLMSAIAQGARDGDPTLEQCRAHVRALYRDDAGEPYLGALLEADEIAAVLGEVLFDPATRPAVTAGGDGKRLRALMRQLQREVLLLDVPADSDEVIGALMQAEIALRDGLQGPAAWWYRDATMPTKPMGANPPPRSLAESESMLKAESYRRNASGEWKMVGMFAGLIACAVAAAAGIGYWILLLLGIVRF